MFKRLAIISKEKKKEKSMYTVSSEVIYKNLERKKIKYTA